MAILDAKSSTVTALGNTYLFGSTIKESVAKSALATFADGGDKYPMLSLTGYINPVQNLNGQSAPYPAGGGKNKYPILVGEDVFVNNGSATHSNSNGALVINTSSSSANSGVYVNSSTSKVAEVLTAFGSDARTISFDIVSSVANTPVKVITGTTTNVTVGTTKQRVSVPSTNQGCTIYAVSTAATLTVSNLQIEAGSTATAYAPYSNICPITGWTGMNVYRTGKNLLKPDIGSYDSNGAKITTNGNYAHIVTNNVSGYPFVKFGTIPKEFPAGTYYINRNEGVNGISYRIIDRSVSPAQQVTITNNAFTLGENRNDLLVEVTLNSTVANGTYDYSVSVARESGDFEEYAGTTYPISWSDEAGTVYGGTLDVTTGVLTVTHFLYVYDGTEPFSKSGTALNGFYNNLSSGVPHTGWPKINAYTSYFPIVNEKASMFTITNNATTYKNNYWYCYLDSGMNFDVDPAIFGTTVDSFKTKLAELYANGTPVSVCAKIKEPYTVQLTPTEVLSLLGSNNVWCDTGDVECTYIADTKLYIDSKL